MSEQLLLLTENFLAAAAQFPQHTVAASSEASGYPVDKVANERRHVLERFEPNNTNTDVTVTATCNLLRAADACVIDRESNHRGYRYQVRLSDDAFATPRTVWDVNPIPSVAGGTPAGASGCVTTEGAWIKTWDADASYGWQLVSKAMGSGLKPLLTGVWIGKSWQPTQYLLRFPLEDQHHVVQYAASTSPYAWQGRGPVAQLRQGTLRLGLPTYDDEAAYEYHIVMRYLTGRPMWVCWQKTSAPWRAMLVTCPPGAAVNWVRDPAFHPLYRAVDIPFIEEQPAVL